MPLPGWRSTTSPPPRWCCCRQRTPLVKPWKQVTRQRDVRSFVPFWSWRPLLKKFNQFSALQPETRAKESKESALIERDLFLMLIWNVEILTILVTYLWIQHDILPWIRGHWVIALKSSTAGGITGDSRHHGSYPPMSRKDGWNSFLFTRRLTFHISLCVIGKGTSFESIQARFLTFW